MTRNDYHFVSKWKVEARIEEVADILSRAIDLPRWWPSVYLGVREIEPGEANGVGKVVSLETKGWLPYRLRWSFRVTEATYPSGFALEAFGDLTGSGRWTLTQNGPWVDITYDWRIRADKPLLRFLSFLFKPVFAANHRWAMARGEKSLKLEVLRRRTTTPEEAAKVPRPPGPTFTFPSRGKQ